MKRLDLTVSILFIAFIFVFGILYFIIPDISFSENENRMLAQAPKITVDGILDGSFEDDFESYMTDQFPFRNFWVTANTVTRQSILNKDLNGVYIGKNGYLFEKFEHIDKNRMKKQTEALAKFADRTDTNIYFAIVPTSIAIMSDNLPFFAPAETKTTYDDLSNEYEYIKEMYAESPEKVETIDVFSVLNEHKDEYIYYRTDHHWTTLGAFYAYEKLGEAMNFETNSIDEYNVTDVSDSFLGTFYSKGNFIVKPDTISRFDLKNEINYTASDDTGKIYESLYDDEYLTKKDKYSYFMSGNPAHLTVNTDVCNGKKLVVIKDSYTHCLLPFFISHYEEIHMIDLRYINDNITDLVNEISPNDVLIIYNAKTLSDDTNFVKLGFTPRNN